MLRNKISRTARPWFLKHLLHRLMLLCCSQDCRDYVGLMAIYIDNRDYETVYAIMRAIFENARNECLPNTVMQITKTLRSIRRWMRY